MHDHGTESRGHVLFRVTRGNTSGTCIETKFNLFQSGSSRTNTHYERVCSSRQGLKQIKLCFNARAGCEAHAELTTRNRKWMDLSSMVMYSSMVMSTYTYTLPKIWLRGP